MEHMNPSLGRSIDQPIASGQNGAPFSRALVALTKQAYIQLKWESRYWRRQHARGVAREASLKQELERAQAEIRDLKQRLYGQRSEKGAAPSEAQPRADQSSRPRGQAPGSQGHGRTPRPHRAVIEEWRALPAESQVCPGCKAPFARFPGTEDSDLVEIQVSAYVRKIQRLRYRKTCQYPEVPGLITAPPAPRLIPKSSLGVAVGVEVLLRNYLYAIPTNRLGADLKNLGVPMAQGTLTGGLKKLAPCLSRCRRRCGQGISPSSCSTGTKRVGRCFRPWRERSAIAGCCG